MNKTEPAVDLRAERRKFLLGVARYNFEQRMKRGTRPQVYCMIRLAGGDYLSHYTEMEWRAYRDGFLCGMNEVEE